MSEVDRFLLENEKILYQVQRGFLPWLFGEEKVFITNLRSIKVVWFGLSTRKTFKFLPHPLSQGQGIFPAWNWKAMLYVGFFCFIILLITFSFIFNMLLHLNNSKPQVELVAVILALIFSVFFALLTGKMQMFAVYGKPEIRIFIKNNNDIEKSSKIVTDMKEGKLDRSL